MFSIKVHSPLMAQLAIKGKFPFLHRDKRFTGKAMWPFIFHAQKHPRPGLIFHEEVHLKQQLRGLLIFFYIKYAYYSITRGYWDNPYEIEAREKTDQWLLANPQLR